MTPARMLLLAVLAGGAGSALALLIPSDPAAAADEPAAGSGLLGAVSQTLGTVGETLETTASATDSLLSEATQALIPAAGPVGQALPAEVVDPVAQIIPELDTTVSVITATVDDVATTTAGSLAAATQAGAVEAIVAPAASVVDATPVIGAVTTALGTTQVLIATADAADRALAHVVGTTASTPSVLPGPPLSALDPIVGTLVRPTGAPAEASNALEERSAVRPAHLGVAPSSARAGAPPGATSSAGAPASVASATAAPTPLALPGHLVGLAADGAGATASATFAGSAAYVVGPLDLTPRAATDVGLPGNDALPGAPVFDTDAAPD